MLYGIREDLLKGLQKEGYPCRQYIVYGKEWYLYLCNRIAENPDNLFQFIIDIVEQAR
jgi:proline dehydrogenase